MTCSRVFYGLLAALFGYVVVTVAAFRYLEWWQAILASAVTLGLIVFGGKLLVKAAVGRLGAMAQGLMANQSKALKDATVDVHAVRPVPPPADLHAEAEGTNADEFDRAEAAADLRNLRWFQIELSIFPDRGHTGPADEWHPETLVLVPASAKPPQPFGGFAGTSDGDETIPLRVVRVLVDGDPMPADEAVTGPQRLRFVAGVPAKRKELSLRYVVHQFGRIRLPADALPARPPA